MKSAEVCLPKLRLAALNKGRSDCTLYNSQCNLNTICPTQLVNTTSRYHRLISQTTKPSTPAGPTDEEKKKLERLAKLEAWKAKQAEKERKKELDAANNTRNLLKEIDQKAAGVSGTSTPAVASGQSSPTPYAGKFDPKAIAKKASTAPTVPSTLGNDFAVPVKQKPGSSASTGGTKANERKVGLQGSLTRKKPVRRLCVEPANFVKGTPETSLKANSKVSGFGFGSKASTDPDKAGSKRTLDFDDEDATRKKLEKLPTPPLEDGTHEDAALANGYGEEEEDEDYNAIADGGTEEESAAAARAAAAKREERIQNQSRAEAEAQAQAQAQIEAADDVEMTEAPAEEPIAEQPADEVEEVDPLDAFMSDLTNLKPRAPVKLNSKRKQDSAEIMFGDENDDLEPTENNPDDILAMASKRKKKDIPTVNHAKMNYETFRKSFYTEPTELSELNEGQVADLRLELDGIKVRGVDVPKPVTKWAQCGLGVPTLEVIRKLNYDAPTSIQSQAIPAIMSGRDVIGVAKTGSGKTIAFLLPMFRHIKDQRQLDGLDGPIGLVMTPTRELATQIHKECKPFIKALGLRAVCAYGGAPIKDQIAELKRGAEIVVCTPGRMIDLLAANSGRVTNLRRVTYIVLDEADRMFDMGFEPQVMKILANVRPDRQTVLFSATFPRNMESLARKTLTKPVEIVVGGRSVVAPEITQIVEVRAEDSKFLRLLELLGELYDRDEEARTLIFVDRQESADTLLRDLMRKGYPCQSIHGGKDQFDRDSAIDDFKAGVIPVLIATSVAARGLDVKQLKLVVNYDAPNHLEDYVHRAGRTGRAGNTGTAVTFLTEEQERYSIDIAKALRQSGQDIPAPLQKLVDSFIEKVKAGKEKASGSGFGGKGLERLDQERDAARNRERRTFKTGDDNDEEEKEETTDDKSLDAIMAKATGAVKARDAPPAATAAAAPTPASTSATNSLIPKGVDLDNIVVHRREEASASGTSGPKDPLAQVQAAVNNITSRLTAKGSLRPGQPIDNKGPDAGAFHATLEINDFPQKARWAVTNRTNVAKILEQTGTSITTKGNFYGAGKEPTAGDQPKLYILVEGDTENVVKMAMLELARLLKEGTAAAIDSEARAPASGRYTVV